MSRLQRPPYEHELSIARKAASAARKIQLRSFHQTKLISIKADASPVTQVDTACEAAIRRIVSAAFPGDGFLGEESGKHEGKSRRRWIVDPIDGTRPFIRGIPTFSSLIALEEDGDVVAGVMDFPALNETYWAAKGVGAYCNGRPIHVSSVKRPAEALGSAMGFVEKASSRCGRRLLRLMRHWGYSYGFMDAYTYASVASGKIDICINLLDKPWDCAAACCIIREAGGRFSDIRGRRTIYGGSTVVSNGFLHDHALAWFTQR